MNAGNFQDSTAVSRLVAEGAASSSATALLEPARSRRNLAIACGMLGVLGIIGIFMRNGHENRGPNELPMATASDDRGSEREGSPQLATVQGSHPAALLRGTLTANPKPKEPKSEARRATKPKRLARSQKSVKSPILRKQSKRDKRKLGTLALRSTPNCDIYIDGRKTGLKTPGTLRLSAGRHKVMLVNRKLGIKKPFSVRIKSGKKTRISKRFL